MKKPVNHRIYRLLAFSEIVSVENRGVVSNYFNSDLKLLQKK
jgi:hypothetical protein